ncbi:MAG TPA: hypothetical protein VNR91_09905, partial [Sphingomonas sp.]|nr:hypothetical protein [Sphingomonas sp.]
MGAWRTILMSLLALGAPTGAFAQVPPDLRGDLIHADVPLFGDGDTKWPTSFIGDDGDFGCSSRVGFGDWLYRPGDSGGDDDVSWYRITNYGVFHCYAIVRTASERGDLARASFTYAFFVPLGDVRVRGKRVELWALQQGGRPG